MFIKTSSGFINVNLIESVQFEEGYQPIHDKVRVYAGGDVVKIVHGVEARRLMDYLSGIAFLDLTKEQESK